MNKVHTFKRALSLLTACMIPLTGMLSSAPLTAKAADNYVTFNTKTSSIVSNGTEGSTTITGRSISKNNDATLNYKYTGNIFTARSSMYDYRSDDEIDSGSIKNSNAEGFTDVYTKLNRAISQQIVSPYSDNLTIMYQSDQSSNSDIKVQLIGQGQNNGTPGAAMTYDSSLGKYVYTVKYDDIGFVPDQFIINGNGNSWHTNTVYKTLEKGKSYSFFKDVITEGTALSIFSDTCPYDVPLYFGCFYRGNAQDTDVYTNYWDTNKADGTLRGTNGYNFYNNFYWQSNIALRGDYDASVQNLVDSELVDDTIAQNGVKLPYFNDEWADSHPGLIKYWHDIAFPFYEIDVDPAYVHGDVSDSDSDKGKYVAKYYEFNSKERNLYLETDDTNKTGKYKETNTVIWSQATVIRNESGIKIDDNVRTESYLPFNASDNSQYNNLGFGTSFEMDFKIRSDGKVDTFDKTTGKPTGKSVNATFEFMGDDDVWVFIDGKLILDLGGAHKDTTGIIDFAEKKAIANDAFAFGKDTKDSLKSTLGEYKEVNLTGIMADGTFDSQGNYDETVTHHLKMFYMERGMYESDLLVRFNFAAIPNNNTLKIKEVTQFKDINAGLLDLTKKAADYDVFDYSISNNGTSADDVGESGIVSPTYNYYQRDNLGQKALLSGQTLEDPTKYVYLDVSTFTSWLNGGAKIAAYVYGNGKTEKTVLGTLVEDNLYRFDTDGYKGIDFIRVSKNCSASFPYEGYLNYTKDDNGDGYWNRVKYGDFIPGATYKITGWDSGEFESESEGVVYEIHNFDPTQGNAVKNVNYNWTDEMASVISGTDTNRLVGTTDGNGTFRLMYGTDDKESSAEFLKQFKKGSTMTVNQNDELKTVTRTNPETTPETFGSDLGRTVSEYYDTTVTVVDKGGNTILSGAMTDTDYAYQNTASVDSKEPVQITETFVNTPKVGAITVTKKLNPNDNVTDDFVFTIRLYDVFGVTGKDELTVTDYSAITANKTLTTVDTVIEGKSVKAGQFTLKRDETLTIQGVPYGTKYTVMETAVTEKYEQQSTTADGEKTVYEGTFDDTHTNITPAAQNQETVVNTRLTNSLTLSKVLSGDYSKTTVNDSTPFEFEVTLIAPAGVDLSMYTFTTTPSGITIADKTGFTVNVSVDQSVTISGIPYGTQYQVKETTAMENWTDDGIKTGEIGKAASAETITNTYTPPAPELGNLTVSKNVVNFTGSDEIPDSDKALQFSFTVTLKDESGTLLTGTVSYPATGIPTGTELEFVDGIATFTLSDDKSVTISNIPAGYRYEVTEADMAGFEKIIPANATGTIVKDQTITTAFTNQKIFQPYELPAAGFEDTRLTWILLMAGMAMFGLLYWYVNRKTMTKE